MKECFDLQNHSWNMKWFGDKETGVRRIRLHDLRHSHASLLVEMGFQPLAIAERWGMRRLRLP